MSQPPELNVILGLASTVAEVQARAAQLVMGRARNVRPAELTSTQRMVAVLKEDWECLRDPRAPIIDALAARMGNPDTDLIVENILGIALATAGEDGVT